jgi:hypothetical protein
LGSRRHAPAGRRQGDMAFDGHHVVGRSGARPTPPGPGKHEGRRLGSRSSLLNRCQGPPLSSAAGRLGRPYGLKHILQFNFIHACAVACEQAADGRSSTTRTFSSIATDGPRQHYIDAFAYCIPKIRLKPWPDFRNRRQVVAAEGAIAPTRWRADLLLAFTEASRMCKGRGGLAPDILRGRSCVDDAWRVWRRLRSSSPATQAYPDGGRVTATRSVVGHG